MNRMKRWSSIFLAAAFALMATGCQNQLTADGTDNPQTNSVADSGSINSEMPEIIQDTDTEILGRADLPTYEYEYETREICLENDGQMIYGIAYIPQTGTERVPLVISSHGLGGSYRSNLAYAEQFAVHGLAVYCFDFCGGGGRDSEGSTTQMSVMTEVSDVEVILEAAKGWDFVDMDKIVLYGTSQGGIVSAITAARHSDEIAGLILCYPAFLVSDSVHEKFDSLDDVPDSYQFYWLTAGRPYAADIWDYDVYSEIGNYDKKCF